MVRDHRLESYQFKSGGLVGDAFTSHSWRSINGVLEAIRVGANNYTATGSLFLITSGTGEVIWSLQSGTVTGNVAQATLYYPVTSAVNSVNTSLSGTNSNGVWKDIPLLGHYVISGVGVGASKSGTGIELIYRMG